MLGETGASYSYNIGKSNFVKSPPNEIAEMFVKQSWWRAIVSGIIDGISWVFKNSIRFGKQLHGLKK